jgi:hypothetical protein
MSLFKIKINKNSKLCKCVGKNPFFFNAKYGKRKQIKFFKKKKKEIWGLQRLTLGDWLKG